MNVDYEVSFRRELVAVLNHCAWRWIEIVELGVLLIVPESGWPAKWNKIWLQTSSGFECFHDQDVRLRTFISRRCKRWGSILNLVLMVGCKPHFSSEVSLVTIMVFTRRTPPMNIHIASSCGSESFIEVDLLRSFRGMVHSLVAELFRAVN